MLASAISSEDPQSGDSIVFQGKITPNSRTLTRFFERFNKPNPKSLLPLNKEVQAAYKDLSRLAMKETWQNKSRFPSCLRMPLLKCAKLALDTRSRGYVIEDNFFAHLQNILPYNKFTLKKLIYRGILPHWSKDLEKQRESMIAMFKERVQIDGSVCGLTVNGTDKQNEDAVELKTSFLWTQGLRLLLWEFMEKNLEIAAVFKELKFVDPANYKQEPESDEQVVEQAYTKIFACFPEGWITIEEVKTQYTKLREKISNQEKEEEKKFARASALMPFVLNEAPYANASSPTESPASAPRFQDPKVNETVAPSSPKTDAYRPISPVLSPVSVATPNSREPQSRFLSAPESEPQLGYSRRDNEAAITDIRSVSGSVQRDYFHRNEYRPNSSPIDQQLQQQRKLPLAPAPAPSGPAPIRRPIYSSPVSTPQYPRQFPPLPLPLPPSPISPQTLSTAVVPEPSTKTSRIEIGAMKRTNEDRDRMEYAQSRWPGESAVPAYQSMAGATHQEIYEYLLHSKRESLKRVRVDNGLGITSVGDMADPINYQYIERTPSSHTQQRQQMQTTLHHHARMQEPLDHAHFLYQERILRQHDDEVQIIERNQTDGYYGGTEYGEVRRERPRVLYYVPQEQIRYRYETDIGRRDFIELDMLEEHERQQNLDQIRKLQYRAQRGHLTTHSMEIPQSSMERLSDRIERSHLALHSHSQPQLSPRPALPTHSSHSRPPHSPRSSHPPFHSNPYRKPPASLPLHAQQARVEIQDNQHSNHRTNLQPNASVGWHDKSKELGTYAPPKSSQPHTRLDDAPRPQVRSELHQSTRSPADEDTHNYIKIEDSP